MREPRPRRTLLLLALLLPPALGLGTALGSVPLPAGGLLDAALRAVGLPSLAGPPLDATQQAILWSVRLPRVLLAALVGGGLAVVGATLQAVFRNPLADSGLLGVGAGAALGAVVAVHLGHHNPPLDRLAARLAEHGARAGLDGEVVASGPTSP